MFIPNKNQLTVINYITDQLYTSMLIPPAYFKNATEKRQIEAMIRVVLLKGLELRVPPMQAIAEIAVIKGKPVITSKLMLALIYRDFPHSEIIFEKMTSKCCLIKAKKKPNMKPMQFEYTIDDARKAELLGKGTWMRYPRQMLRWRAVANMARTLFPEVIMGCYLPEELDQGNLQSDPNTLGNYDLFEDLEVEDQESVTEQEVIQENNEDLNRASSNSNKIIDLALEDPQVITKKIDLSLSETPQKSEKRVKKVKKKQTIDLDALSNSIASITAKEPSLKPKKQEQKDPQKDLADPKDLKDPDFYYSSKDGEKVDSDLPFNLLRNIIQPAILQEDRDPFVADVSKYFKDLLDGKQTLGETLIEAYNQYCEVDLKDYPVDVLKAFNTRMQELIHKIYKTLPEMQDTENVALFALNLLKKLNLPQKYKAWILGFLETRGLIQIEENKVQVMI